MWKITRYFNIIVSLYIFCGLPFRVSSWHRKVVSGKNANIKRPYHSATFTVYLSDIPATSRSGVTRYLLLSVLSFSASQNLPAGRSGSVLQTRTIIICNRSLRFQTELTITQYFHLQESLIGQWGWAWIKIEPIQFLTGMKGWSWNHVVFQTGSL